MDAKILKMVGDLILSAQKIEASISEMLGRTRVGSDGSSYILMPFENVEDSDLQKKLIQEYEEWYQLAEIIISRLTPEKKETFQKQYEEIDPKGKPNGIKSILNFTFPFHVEKVNIPILNFNSRISTQISLLNTIEKKLELLRLLPDELDSFDALISTNPQKILLLIFRRFHDVVRQLRERRIEKKVPRPTLDVKDEYDVQELLHAILRIFFQDIRKEEWTPSYAGASSRIDFILKDENIAIETKKTRDNLRGKEVGEQLIIDSKKYQTYPDCKSLICFVYDPDGYINNPIGFENDLRKSDENFSVSVYIFPK